MIKVGQVDEGNVITITAPERDLFLKNKWMNPCSECSERFESEFFHPFGGSLDLIREIVEADF